MTEQVQSDEAPARQADGKRPWLIITAIALPLIVVAGILSALTYVQDGLPVRLADWQFARFGQSLPIFNVVIFIALAILVGVVVDWLVRLSKRRRQRAAALDPAVAAVVAEHSADRFARLLTYVGTTMIVMAGVTAIWALLLPRAAETLTFGNDPGARVIAGRPDGRLMVTVVNDVLLHRETAYYVPVIDPTEPRVIRRFVEFVPDDSWNGSAVPQVDIAKPFRSYRIALPAFIPTLYAGNGYTLAKPYDVLTQRAISIQLPYYITAIQLALIGLLIVGAAALQRRHVRKLRSAAAERAAEERAAAGPAPATV